MGRIAVITLAFIAVLWLRDELQYRWFVRIPGSLDIAAMGAF